MKFSNFSVREIKQKKIVVIIYYFGNKISNEVKLCCKKILFFQILYSKKKKYFAFSKKTKTQKIQRNLKFSNIKEMFLGKFSSENYF